MIQLDQNLEMVLHHWRLYRNFELYQQSNSKKMGKAWHTLHACRYFAPVIKPKKPNPNI